MPACCRCMGKILILVLLFGALASRSSAQDSKQLDQRIYDLLKEVINTGADVYNSRAEERDIYTRESNRAGCYRIYQGALLTLKPLLSYRPELQKVIDNSLAKAATQNSMAERAFTLREALDEIRRALKPGGEEKNLAGAGPLNAAPMPGGAATTLWARLGGEPKVAKIVDELLARVSKDPKVDFYRGGKFKPTDLEMLNTKARFIEYISAASGAKAYDKGGRPMAAVHKGMGITDAQFTAMVDDLKQVLTTNDIKAPEIQELVQIVESTRKDIVEAKSAAGDKVLDGFQKPK